MTNVPAEPGDSPREALEMPLSTPCSGSLRASEIHASVGTGDSIGGTGRIIGVVRNVNDPRSAPGTSRVQWGHSQEPPASGRGLGFITVGWPPYLPSVNFCVSLPRVHENEGSRALQPPDCQFNHDRGECWRKSRFRHLYRNKA